MYKNLESAYNISIENQENVQFACCMNKWDPKKNLYVKQNLKEQKKCCLNTCEIFYDTSEEKDTCKQKCKKLK